MEKRTSIYTKKNVATAKSVDFEKMNIVQKEMWRDSVKTLSENGANKLSSTGDIFVDDFGSIGKFKSPRPLNEIFETMNNLWCEDKLLALKEMAYIRLITRDIKLSDGTIVKGQKGQGLKFEYIGRLYWLAKNETATFEKNFNTFVAIGSWHDMIELLRTDLYYTVSKTTRMWDVVVSNICDNSREDIDLIKKYLPNNKSANKCKTVRNEANNFIAKKIAREMFKINHPEMDVNKNLPFAYKEYRKFKSTGTAHVWQQCISRGDYDGIDFSKISGRALNELVNNKFLNNHNLMDKFVKWMNAQPSVKYTGFPYELWGNLRSSNRVIGLTASKQFETLVAKGKSNTDTRNNFLVCVDTSSSMECKVEKNISAKDVAYSMALYFSYFLDGPFKNNYLEFADSVTLRQWVGETPYERATKSHLYTTYGSTNFLGVAHKLVNMLNRGYAESDFPSGVLCVSDGEFNAAYYGVDVSSTSFEEFKKILLNGGFSTDFVSNFKLVLWDVPRGQKAKFEGVADAENFFYMSGFDPSGIAFLCGGEVKDEDGNVIVSTPKNARELFECAMNQDVLNMLVV